MARYAPAEMRIVVVSAHFPPNFVSGGTLAPQRQAHADRDFMPCSLVVSCGNCECEVDRPWLEARNAELAGRLAAADLVLAVSESEAKVLAANGIAPDRLAVDENAVPVPEQLVGS